MTPRQKLAAVFAVPSHTWQDAPAVVADYLKLVSRFGMEETLRTWAEEYVRYHAGRCLWDAEFLTSNYQFINCINVGGAPFIFEYLIKQKLQQFRFTKSRYRPVTLSSCGGHSWNYCCQY